MLPPDPDPAEQLRASELLRLAHSRIGRLLRSLPIGVAVVETDGVIEAVNPTISSLFSYDDRELVGQNIAILLKNPPWSAGESLMDWCGKHRDKTVQLEGWSKDSELIPIDFAVRDFDSDGRERLVVIIQDVTQRFLTDKLKQEFVSMVSHDIRVPLSGIRTFLDLLKTSGDYGTLSEVGRQRAELAEQNVERILSLVQQILDLDHLGSGLVNIQKERIDASDLVDVTVAGISELADAKHIEIRTSAPADLVFEGDRERLGQVIVNLLANAIDYSSEHSCVEVTATQKDELVSIAVRDYGPGILDTDKPFVFERFHQGSKRSKRGYGLGLAISREIVQQHLGTITCENAPDHGTIFRFELPLKAPDDSQCFST